MHTTFQPRGANSLEFKSGLGAWAKHQPFTSFLIKREYPDGEKETKFALSNEGEGDNYTVFMNEVPKEDVITLNRQVVDYDTMERINVIDTLIKIHNTNLPIDTTYEITNDCTVVVRYYFNFDDNLGIIEDRYKTSFQHAMTFADAISDPEERLLDLIEEAKENHEDPMDEMGITQDEDDMFKMNLIGEYDGQPMPATFDSIREVTEGLYKVEAYTIDHTKKEGGRS